MEAAWSRNRFPIKLAGKLLLSAACLFALYRWIDPAEFIRKLKGIAPLPFFIAMGLNFLMQILNAGKIRMLFPPPGPPFRGMVAANFIAVFFRTFIPGGIGGEVARWAYMSRESGSQSRTLAAILMDRTTGLWAQTLLAISAWLWLSRRSMALWIAAPMALLILAMTLGAGLWSYRIVAWAAQKLRAWLARRSGDPDAIPEDIAEGLSQLLGARIRFAKVAGLSILNHLVVLAIFMLIDRSVGGALNWAQAALFLLCYTAILMLPVTLGNWGFSEGTLGILYHYAGSHSATGVLISLLLRAMNLPAAGIGWYLFLARRGPPKEDRIVPRP